MPCWQVQTVSVEFKAANAELLAKAAKALGYFVQQAAGVMTLSTSRTSFGINLMTSTALIQQDQQGELNALKQEYSRQAIKLAAKLGGWQVQFKNANQGNMMRQVL